MHQLTRALTVHPYPRVAQELHGLVCGDPQAGCKLFDAPSQGAFRHLLINVEHGLGRHPMVYPVTARGYTQGKVEQYPRFHAPGFTVEQGTTAKPYKILDQPLDVGEGLGQDLSQWYQRGFSQNTLKRIFTFSSSIGENENGVHSVYPSEWSFYNRVEKLTVVGVDRKRIGLVQ